MIKDDGIIKVSEPYEVAVNYLNFGFFIELIAVLPFSMINRQLIVLRYLKISKFISYQKYIDEMVTDLTQNYLNIEQIRKLNSVLKLLFKLLFISHLIANGWVLIGQYEFTHIDEEGNRRGWIQVIIRKGICENTNFFYLYVTAWYWVITTFSSIGYGEIIGETDLEYLYVMLVQMIGIGFFGYMVGTFQKLILGFSQIDYGNEQQEKVKFWLLQLDKTMAFSPLPQNIYKEVTEYYYQQFKWDTKYAYENPLFDMLKPRLQQSVKDIIFRTYLSTFKIILEGLEPNFHRNLFTETEFKYYGLSSKRITNDKLKMKHKIRLDEMEDEDDIFLPFIRDQDIPYLSRAGEKSKKVHFILQGNVHVMNSNGIYDYAMIQEGGYYGDISTLLDMPDEFSYLYNPYGEKPLLVLSISAEKFMNICNKFPAVKETLTERAQKRLETFRNFK